MSNAKVTLHDVYDITNRIEDKLDKMEERISTLEFWRVELMGKITIVAGIVSLAFTLIWDSIRKRINL